MALRSLVQVPEDKNQALTVQKVVHALSKMPELGWRFVVGRRVVCRSIKGPYLRGIHVDRTSSPGTYWLRALQTPWCMIDDIVTLSHSVGLRWLHGGLDQIVDGLRHELDNDDWVRRCVMAEPTEPFLYDPRLFTGEENNTPHPWVERAIMRALDGDGIGALPLLRRATERYPDQTRETADHKWKIIPEVISCIERGGNVEALLHPLAEEAKTRITIKPLRRQTY